MSFIIKDYKSKNHQTTDTNHHQFLSLQNYTQNKQQPIENIFFHLQQQKSNQQYLSGPQKLSKNSNLHSISNQLMEIQQMEFFDPEIDQKSSSFKQIFSKFKQIDSKKIEDKNFEFKEQIFQQNQSLKTRKQIESLQKNNQNYEEESQKLSMIRGLEKKLERLQSKIKIKQSKSLVDKKQYKFQEDQNKFSTLILGLQSKNSVIVDPQIQNNRQSTLIQKRSEEFSNFSKRKNNQALIDSPLIKLEEQLKSQTKIIQIIKYIQIPLLIEICSDNLDQIKPKKNFYFEENQEIHQSFKQIINKQNIQEKAQNYCPLQISIKNDKDYGSVLSTHQQSISFHKMKRQNNENILYNDQKQAIEPILTDLQINIEENERFIELEGKFKDLQIENILLKEKLTEYYDDIKNLEDENVDLWSQRHNSYIIVEKIQEQKISLKNLILSMKENMILEIISERKKIKSEYEQIIEDLENQQSKYSEQMILYQETFEDQKLKQKNLLMLIEGQNERFINLEKQLNSKSQQNQLQHQSIQYLEDVFKKKQFSLFKTIQCLQIQNDNLKLIIQSFQKRQQEEGFILLPYEVDDLKDSIEQKQEEHIKQINSLQKRYQNIIKDYQKQLQQDKMKQKVNKSISTSFSIIQNTQPQTPDIKKRQSLRSTQFSFQEVDCLQQNPNDISSELLDSVKLDLKKCESMEQNEASPILIDSKSTNLLQQQIEQLLQKNSKLSDLYGKQRQEKLNISKKLMHIDSIMKQYIQDLEERENDVDETERLLSECMSQLQIQHMINKRLKSRLHNFQAKDSQSIKCPLSINQNDIKTHHVYKELEKNYKAAKKYIKVLEGIKQQWK